MMRWIVAVRSPRLTSCHCRPISSPGRKPVKKLNSKKSACVSQARVAKPTVQGGLAPTNAVDMLDGKETGACRIWDEEAEEPAVEA